MIIQMSCKYASKFSKLKMTNYIAAAILLTFCIDSFSQITLENYYKHCSSYPPIRRVLVRNIEKLDNLYHTDIQKDSILLSKLVYPKTWMPGYVNYFKEPISGFLYEARKYENVKRNLDLIYKYRERSGIYSIGALPIMIFAVACIFTVPYHIANGDSWLSSPVTEPLMITLSAIGVTSMTIACSYKITAEFKFMKLPYEYNGAVIVKSRSDWFKAD